MPLLGVAMADGEWRLEPGVGSEKLAASGMTDDNPSQWRTVPWTRFDAVDDGRRLKIDAQLGKLRIDRVEVEETRDSVTITLYERVADGPAVFRFDVGFPAVVEVLLADSLGSRIVCDGAKSAARGSKPTRV